MDDGAAVAVRERLRRENGGKEKEPAFERLQRERRVDEGNDFFDRRSKVEATEEEEEEDAKRLALSSLACRVVLTAELSSRKTKTK